MNSNWRLEAVSKAAKARKINTFSLKEGTNYVGKSSKRNDIYVPSVLCSRSHCMLNVDKDKDAVFLVDTSTNGTYVHQYKYQQNQTPKQLKHGDFISFGFDFSRTYDITDRNVLIYRVVHDNDLETINIFDSDDETADDVDNDLVVVLDSDSNNSDNSDNETGNDANGIPEGNEEDDVDDEDDDDDSDDSEELEDENDSRYYDDLIDTDLFDVNMPDDTVNNSNVTNEPCSSTLNNSNVTNEPCSSTDSSDQSKIENDTVDANDEQSNGTAATAAAPARKTGAKDSKATTEQLYTKQMSEEDLKLERLRQSLLNKQRKPPPVISAQPLRKRRKTVTEREYDTVVLEKREVRSCTAEEKKQRAELLSKIALSQKAARSNETLKERVPTKPKVKVTVQNRNDLLTKEISKNCSP